MSQGLVTHESKCIQNVALCYVDGYNAKKLRRYFTMATAVRISEKLVRGAKKHIVMSTIAL